jgi:hypothetical protein
VPATIPVWVSATPDASSLVASGPARFASPKSTTLTMPSRRIMTFSGLMSRWHDAAGVRGGERRRNLTRRMSTISRSAIGTGGDAAAQRDAVHELRGDKSIAPADRSRRP